MPPTASDEPGSGAPGTAASAPPAEKRSVRLAGKGKRGSAERAAFELADSADRYDKGPNTEPVQLKEGKAPKYVEPFEEPLPGGGSWPNVNEREPGVPFYGVYCNRRAKASKYRADCTVAGRNYYLGVFPTALEAAIVYDKFARTHAKPQLNFPDDQFPPVPPTVPVKYAGKPQSAAAAAREREREATAAAAGSSMAATGSGGEGSASPSPSNKGDKGDKKEDEAPSPAAVLGAPAARGGAVRATGSVPSAAAGRSQVRSSRYVGVSYDLAKTAWVACCWAEGKSHYLGRHATEHDAARAYD
ncbi:hypothetical protein T492DRAFT_894759, partial [Pavlovales sp. CCMP2436]